MKESGCHMGLAMPNAAICKVADVVEEVAQ